MALIKHGDIVTLRKFVKINFTATPEGSFPDMDTTEREHLVPLLTEDVYDELVSQVNANNITWPSLLTLARAAAAPLAVWMDLPFIQTQIGDSGLKTSRNEHEESSHQWEYREVQRGLVNKGMAALEKLLEHLIAKGPDYDWSNAEATGSFIRTGNEFTRFVTLHQPNLTFQQIKPLMAEVEDHFIRASIGDEFFEELRDNATPSNQERIAIQLIKKTIAQYTAVRCVERLPVKITPHGLMASLQSNTEGNPETPAAGSPLSLLMTSSQREGDNYHNQLMEYLNKNASSSLFNTFFSSEYYKAPVVVTTQPNDTRRGVCAFN